MKDESGKVLTETQEILDATINHYQEVLRNRKIKDSLEDHKKEREDLAKTRMRQSKENKTPDWDINDLDQALKDLKKNKSSDSLGHINELYKPDVIGSDLMLALLKLINKIKEQQIFSHALEACNITSIFKNKGKRQILIITGAFSDL